MALYEMGKDMEAALSEPLKRLVDAQFIDEELKDLMIRKLGLYNPILVDDVKAFISTWMNQLAELYAFVRNNKKSYEERNAAYQKLQKEVEYMDKLRSCANDMEMITLFAMVPAVWAHLYNSPELKKKILSHPFFFKIRSSCIVSNLIKIANELDARGFFRQADIIDNILKRGL